MTHLKIRKIGNSLGVVLPKEILEELDMAEGDKLLLTKTEDGIALTPEEAKLAKTMEITEKFMKQYHNTLRELAK